MDEVDVAVMLLEAETAVDTELQADVRPADLSDDVATGPELEPRELYDEGADDGADEEAIEG